MRQVSPIICAIQSLISNHLSCFFYHVSLVDLVPPDTVELKAIINSQYMDFSFTSSDTDNFRRLVNRPNGAGLGTRPPVEEYGLNPERALTCATSASLPDMHCAPLFMALFGLGPGADDITKTNRRAKL